MIWYLEHLQQEGQSLLTSSEVRAAYETKQWPFSRLRDRHADHFGGGSLGAISGEPSPQTVKFKPRFETSVMAMGGCSVSGYISNFRSTHCNLKVLRFRPPRSANRSAFSERTAQGNPSQFNSLDFLLLWFGTGKPLIQAHSPTIWNRKLGLISIARTRERPAVPTQSLTNKSF
jgi:hypothetical protein